MGKKTLYFIRHGQTHANSTHVLQGSGIDQPLSSKGVLQAQRLRDRLKDIKVDLFVSSDLKRAKETCDIIKELHSDTPTIELPALREISWGDWEGTSLHTNNLPALIERWNHGFFNEKAPNGESIFETEERSVKCIYDLVFSRKENTIVLVLHGRLMRVILASLLHRDLIQMVNFTHQNTTVNILSVDTEKSFIPLAATYHQNTQLDDSCVELVAEQKDSLVQEVINRSKTIPKSNIQHPDIYFEVVALDSHEHLLPDLV